MLASWQPDDATNIIAVHRYTLLLNRQTGKYKWKRKEMTGNNEHSLVNQLDVLSSEFSFVPRYNVKCNTDLEEKGIESQRSRVHKPSKT